MASCPVRTMIALTHAPVGATIGTLRVGSFNVLAQGLVNREIYPYCSKAALKWVSRNKVMAENLVALAAVTDVICLQEVDHFDDFYKPQLEKLGFAPTYKAPSAKKCHGLVIAFRKEKFEVVTNVEVNFDDLAEGTEGTEREELLRQNVGQVMALRYKGDDAPSYGFVISNCHMFWNWKYRYVRLRQSIKLHEVIAAVNAELRYPVVSCGDYNDCPDTIVYKLLTAPRPFPFVVPPYLFLTPSDHYDPRVSHAVSVTSTKGVQSSGMLVLPLDEAENAAKMVRMPVHPEDAKIEMPDDLKLVPEEVHDARVAGHAELMRQIESLPRLVSSYGTYQDHTVEERYLAPDDKSFWKGEPHYTSFSAKWRGTLDYVFVHDIETETKLVATAVLKIPELSEVAAQVALPNEHHASDHVWVVAELSVCR